MAVVEELKPVVEYLAQHVQPNGATISVDSAEAFARILCVLFDEIREAEAAYLASSYRTVEKSAELSGIFNTWGDAIISLRGSTNWQSVKSEVRCVIEQQFSTAQDVLADFARGEAGVRRMAARLRNTWAEEHRGGVPP